MKPEDAVEAKRLRDKQKTISKLLFSAINLSKESE